jgi:16S rRNA G527 N7-methylase RsmG
LAAARPRWQAFLVESRERKWAFLSAASRKAGLSCRCLNVRVGPRLPPGLPDSLDVVTMRALRLPSEALSLLVGRLGAGGRLLLWQGGREPELPEGAVITRELPLPGSRERRILAVELRGAPS